MTTARIRFTSTCSWSTTWSPGVPASDPSGLRRLYYHTTVLGFCRATRQSAARTRLFKLFNAQNGAPAYSNMSETRTWAACVISSLSSGKATRENTCLPRILLGFCRGTRPSAARTRLFRLINTQNGAPAYLNMSEIRTRAAGVISFPSSGKAPIRHPRESNSGRPRGGEYSTTGPPRG